ncbi:MAG: hypothetical protein KBB46_03340 [Candidatus Pacebacteria bacterium]|nr:hypothetical protein [Candidatus Paceibacterota bacterium]
MPTPTLKKTRVMVGLPIKTHAKLLAKAKKEKRTLPAQIEHMLASEKA